MLLTPSSFRMLCTEVYSRQSSGNPSALLASTVSIPLSCRTTGMQMGTLCVYGERSSVLIALTLTDPDLAPKYCILTDWPSAMVKKAKKWYQPFVIMLLRGLTSRIMKPAGIARTYTLVRSASCLQCVGRDFVGQANTAAFLL